MGLADGTANAAVGEEEARHRETIAVLYTKHDT